MAGIDYSNMTPLTLAKLDEGELKKLYSGLRSILRKRNERYVKKMGVEPVYKTPVPVKEMPVNLLKSEVAEIAYQLSDPETLIGRKPSKYTKAVRTLQSRGFNIKRSQLKSFGRFMDMIRERMGERYRVEVIDSFLELQRQGVRIDVIERNFKKYLESYNSLENFVEAVQETRFNTGGVKTSDILERLLS